MCSTGEKQHGKTGKDEDEEMVTRLRRIQSGGGGGSGSGDGEPVVNLHEKQSKKGGSDCGDGGCVVVADVHGISDPLV
ncbi:hypothetical protein M0804_006196 [Polistes exclamans]|nr:hypothetical protein M0804_006196 [Polistes exclamans]